MKILITGAAGFIGTHLAKYCLNKGHDILLIDNNWPIADARTPSHELAILTFPLPGSNLCQHDVAKRPDQLEQLFENFKPEICYHLAAYASEGRSNHIRSFIHQNNTVGTANVINACVNHKCKLVFTSSVAVYSGSPPFTEAMTPNPIDEYGLSKYMSERSIQIAGKTQGLDWCIIRPRNVYGEGQSIFDRSRNLFGIFCYNALNGLPLTIFGDGSNRRTFTYIRDLIPRLYKAKDISDEIINLGSAVSYTIKEATDMFASVSGYNYIVHTEPRHEVNDAICNTSKSERLLNWSNYNTTRLQIGLENMWEWAKTVSMRPLNIPPPLEVQVNAHSSLK